MSGEKMCANLLIGISSSIHALDVHHYLSLFRDTIAVEIKVIMTSNATDIADPRTVGLSCDDRVFVDLWDQSASVNRAPHLQLTQWADLFVIVPATANTIGKAANGIADDLLSTAILSYPKTVVFVPAMNPVMWDSKALQRNIEVLEKDGHYVIRPESVGIEVGTTARDKVPAPSAESVLPHLKHVRLRELRRDYWDEAIHEKPMTPAQKKLRHIASNSEKRHKLEST